jgi:hypothetical protein
MREKVKRIIFWFLLYPYRENNDPSPIGGSILTSGLLFEQTW